MALFHFGKNKEQSCYCCGHEAEAEAVYSTVDKSNGKPQSIKVLGVGCRSCHEQYNYVKTAVADMGLNVDVEYITDMEKVMKYGVMSMPAIVIDERVVSMGKVLKVADIEALFHKLGYRI